VHSKVPGFDVEVSVKDGRPHIRIAFAASGERVLDTHALSIQGMENMATALTQAAKMTYTELDEYWRKEHATLRAGRKHDAP
jgi:hypothetical protein